MMEIEDNVIYIFKENIYNQYVLKGSKKIDLKLNINKGDKLESIIDWDIKNEKMKSIKYNSNNLKIYKYSKRLSFSLCFKTDNLIVIKTYKRKVKISIYYSCRPYHTLIMPIIKNKKNNVTPIIR